MCVIQSADLITSVMYFFRKGRHYITLYSFDEVLPSHDNAMTTLTLFKDGHTFNISPRSEILYFIQNPFRIISYP